MIYCICRLKNDKTYYLTYDIWTNIYKWVDIESDLPTYIPTDTLMSDNVKYLKEKWLKYENYFKKLNNEKEETYTYILRQFQKTDFLIEL
jgi:hypothetical protein